MTFKIHSTMFGMALLLCMAAINSHGSVSLEDLSVADVSAWFPQATSLESTIHDPGYRLVMNGEQIIGAALLTHKIKPIPAYSGKPIATLVGIDTFTTIVGLKILEHEEPILVVGIKEHDLENFVSQYNGLHSVDKVRVNASNRPGYHSVDGITGATITTMVLNSSIMGSAKIVAETLNWPMQENAVITPRVKTPDLSLDERWQQRLDNWDDQRAKTWSIAIALVVLTLILFFQDWLVRKQKLFRILRYGYLSFTVVFIGYVFSAQLSIVNVLAFIQTFTYGFTWDTLMIDSGIFFLWSFVAVSILLWGRGVFCGWLCPFGAMQELIHELALMAKVPNFEFPPMIHERLWAIKYMVLIVLVGISMDSFSTAAKLAEIEPFKTTITMKFGRDWGYVLYAVGLLILSAINSKFFCKYLCALGASLSILSRFKIFDWLRRRNECGKPCQTCATKCQINAIRPTGEIIESECHYCLDCQLTYWDDHNCPPLIEKRKKREKREHNARIKALDLSGEPKTG